MSLYRANPGHQHGLHPGGQASVFAGQRSLAGYGLCRMPEEQTPDVGLGAAPGLDVCHNLRGAGGDE